LLVCLLAALALSQDTYIASVVEFCPTAVPDDLVSKDQALSVMMTNLARFDTYMAAAKANGTQIIVFPEYGITGMRGAMDGDHWERNLLLPWLEQIPDPDNTSLPGPRPLNPCADAALYPQAPITVQVSCLAKKYQLTTVVDYGDVVSCTPGEGNCRDDGRLQYNTAMAFAPDGSILAKYHKRHLMDEQNWYDVPYDGGKNVSFAAPWNPNIRFGMFICFDVFFEGTEYYHNFAYPTEWDNTVFPGFNATEQQQRWSFLHDANFLCANYGRGSIGSGSGIWTQGTALARYDNPLPQPGEALLTAAVPVLMP